MIQRWDRLDYDALAGSARIIGFDLDNTLANSRKPMLPSVARRFSELTNHIDVAVITGGNYGRAGRQPDHRRARPAGMQEQHASHAHQRHPLLPLAEQRMDARLQP